MKRRALAMAIVTTVLWSGSYIVNQYAFREGIGPLTLSGLRYLAASLLLLIMSAGQKHAARRSLSVGTMILLGILGYAIAQGLQYVGQASLTPTQSSLLLSVFNTLCVMLLDRVWLRENQTGGDMLKMLLLLSGVTLYYAPWNGGAVPLTGALFMLISSFGYALHLTLNRKLLASSAMDTRRFVAIPMLIGSIVLLASGLIREGLPTLTDTLLVCLVYLSAVSGALGFTLWTHSQRALTTFESSSVNNLMLIEIALLDGCFFGRVFNARQIVAILMVFIAIVWIQSRSLKLKRM